MVLIDGHYIARRAFYTTGQLSGGVVFGFLRDLKTFEDLFNDKYVVVAFDFGFGIRKAFFEGYKKSRELRKQSMTEVERIAEADFEEQVKRLRKSILPELGYSNVLVQYGYEADDIIAKISQQASEDEDVTIVSSDHDLHQCLRRNVVCYDPTRKTTTTRNTFRNTWGIKPRQWPLVKAIAGCSTDDVPGVYGVGEATACKWFRGAVSATSKTYKKIENFVASEDYTRNIHLVTLPLPGLDDFKLAPNITTPAKWKKITRELGIHSFEEQTKNKRSDGFGVR